MFLPVCSMTMTGRIIFSLNYEEDSLIQEDPDEEEGHFDLEPPPPRITRFQDAISSLEAVQTFLDSKGHSEEATTVASTMNRLAYLHCASLSSARQSTLEEFFLNVNVYLFVF